MKNFLRKICSICFTITLVATSYGQSISTTTIVPGNNWRCGTDSVMFSRLKNDTAFMQRMANYNNAILAKQQAGGFQPTTSGPYIVPVVFHIIQPTGATPIPYAQIQWQVAELNAAFNNQMQLYTGKLPGPQAINTQIEFRLACISQPANIWSNPAQPGVMRYPVASTNAIHTQGVLDPITNGQMKTLTHPTLLYFPFDNYLNIWCVDNICDQTTNASCPNNMPQVPPTVIGFGTFPWLFPSGASVIDGIVMRNDCVGSSFYATNFNMFSQFDKGAILAHEAGHYLGLYHTFQPNQGGIFTGPLSCYGMTAPTAYTDGDMIYDTPPTQVGADLGGITVINTCNENYVPYSGYGGTNPDENDQLENYMSYSDDDKLNTFTISQAQRMWGAFDNNWGPAIRTNLNDPVNLAATGVDPYGCINKTSILTAIFTYSIAPGSSCSSVIIQFTNPTSIGFSATSWVWSFGANVPNPTYTFTPGNYVVTCTASDGTTTVNYSTTVVVNFNVQIIGQSSQMGNNTTGTVCKGSEQTIFIQFGPGIPSIMITDGNTQSLVTNYMALTQTVVIPYYFIANTSASYSITPFCNNSGMATFNVVDCCPSLIKNGDFETGNTGFATDLDYRTSYNGKWGAYFVGVLNSTSYFTGFTPPITQHVTGQIMQVDGFSGPNILLPTFPSNVCSSSLTPRVWQQVVNGLQPSTTYFYSFKILENYNNTNCSNTAPLNFITSIKSNTITALPIQAFVPTIDYFINNPLRLDWVVYTYTFTTTNNVLPTDNFTVTINQVKKFFDFYYDYFIDNITLNQMTPGVQAVGSATICPGGSVPLSVVTNCNANLANYNFTWLPATGLSCTSCANPIASPGTTTVYTLVATATSTVNPTFISTVTVTVSQPATLTITASQSSVCGTSATLTVLPALTNIVWSPVTGLSCITCSNPVASPTVTTTYTVTGTDANGCATSGSFMLQHCSCTDCATVLSGTVTASPASATTYCINNNITVTGNVNFLVSEFKIKPGVQITVSPNSTLTITGSHLYGCTDMWQGIVLQNGAKLNVIPYNFQDDNASPFIEDAITAIDITGSTVTANLLNINGAIFNRNRVSLAINGYVQQINILLPFSIKNSVFTCRDIPFIQGTSAGIGSWPLTSAVKAANNPITSPLETPYINNNTYPAFPATNTNTVLKTPYAGQKPLAGIVLNNVGTTLNAQTTSPTYYQIKIGANGSLNYNVFDNLHICIDAANSNFTCVNNVFQNTFTFGKANLSGGMGINAIAKDANVRIQVIPGVGINFINKFFNCTKAITTTNYFEHHITFCDIRSTQSCPGSCGTFNPPGKFGIDITTNRFRVINVASNSLFNIENAIIFNANYGLVTIGTIFSNNNGQYSGQVDINGNIIQPHLTGNPITTQYVSNAIWAVNVISTGTYSVIPNTTVNANDNKISGVWRGIYTANWQRKDLRNSNNVISLVADITSVNPFQFGINHSNNVAATSFGNIIFNNTVSGYSSSANPNLHSIYTSLCHNQYLHCNSTSNTYTGLIFNGSQLPTSNYANTMSKHNFGFVLDNNGIIGTQGSATAPMDDRWIGTWSNTPNVPPSKTGTFGSSSATNSNIYVRSSGSFNPNLSSSTSGALGITDYYYNGTSGTILYSTTAPFINCPPQPPPNPNPNSQRILMEQIALDQIPFTLNPVQTKFIAKNQLFRAINADNTLMNNSPVLQNFFTQSQTTSRATFTGIENTIANANVPGARAQTNAFVPQNAIETNYKTFYNIYLNYLTDTIIRTPDSVNLAALANGCPFIDGAVVYQARALYNSAFKTTVFFKDNCENNNEENRAAKLKNYRALNYFDAFVYPNPSSGKVFVAPFAMTEGNLYVKVSDINGRIVFENTLSISNGMADFSLSDINNGVYFVHVTNTFTGENVVKKLIVQH